ncbi:MAG: AI-2E family transporter [Hyphomicrobiaceae bacterium]|nr:AI-2E family transporter [Hyphomicrobiaceae bacterium]
MPMISDSIRNFAAALIAIALIIAGLALGRDVILPLCLASLFAFGLAPIVRRLTAARFPRGLAAAMVVFASVACLGALTTVFTGQLIELAGGLGEYQYNLVQKVRTITGASAQTGKLQRAIETIGAIEKEVVAEVSQSTGTKTDPAAVVVNGEQPKEPLWQQFSGSLHVVALGALTLLFTIFLLVQYQDLRDRVVRVVGTDNMSRTVAALSDAGTRLSDLLLAQFALNASFGLFVGLALAMIGVPNAALWGFSTLVLRFIPYVGSLLAAIPPILLAAAVDPGWSMVAMTVALFAIGEPVVGHLIEPHVLGKRAGLSPLALIVAASFWTLLWGPIGLLLAAPLTMMLVVLGQYIPQFQFISVLLGDEPALAADDELYHRILSGDAIAAYDQLKAEAEQTSPARAADEVLLPALALLARDDRLSDEQRTEIQTTFSDLHQLLLEDLQKLDREEADPGESSPLILLPVRGVADKIAAKLVATLLSERHARIRAIEKAAGLLGVASIEDAMCKSAPQTIVLVTTNYRDHALLKHMKRRILRNHPDAAVYALPATDVMEERTLADDNDNVIAKSVADLAALTDLHADRGRRTVASAVPEAA